MLVSTLAGIPPGRPTLLPPPNPTSAPVQYAIDYVKLLREQLLPGVKSETTGCAAGAETSGWPEGSALDLGKSDRLSCKCVKLEDASVPSQSQMKSAESLYLILWDTVFLLTAPERTCPGYGIVRYVGSMAVTEVSCVRDQPCQLRVKMSPTSTLLVIFDDESRCSIAYKHLERTRETSLRKEYEKLVDSFLLQDRYDDDRLRGV
ncbi:hypothetical protein FOL47_005464 [Perkinsus chesapeaki]|uniref:Uncharacterized protein n=1 Tax=Perkinsus chesapeaki TaxID=330153 RepID=A0A7J6LXH3_PERCH|nr:hypothetical protein FOL47_005464 [Perkinsus chesapeaki]